MDNTWTPKAINFSADLNDVVCMHSIIHIVQIELKLELNL